MSGGIGRRGRGAVGRSVARRRVGVGLFGGAPWASLYLPPSPFCLGPNDVREREHTAFLPIGGRRAFSSPVHGGRGGGLYSCSDGDATPSLPPPSAGECPPFPPWHVTRRAKGGGGEDSCYFRFPLSLHFHFSAIRPFGTCCCAHGYTDSNTQCSPHFWKGYLLLHFLAWSS